MYPIMVQLLLQSLNTNNLGDIVCGKMKLLLHMMLCENVTNYH